VDEIGFPVGYDPAVVDLVNYTVYDGDPDAGGTLVGYDIYYENLPVDHYYLIYTFYVNAPGNTNVIPIINDHRGSNYKYQEVNTIITITPKATDLNVNKTVDNPQPEIDTVVQFTIIITNEGPDDATDVIVEDILPSGLIHVDNSTSQGTYNHTTGLWDIGFIANGSHVVMYINTTVNQLGNITNWANITYSEVYSLDISDDSDDETIVATPEYHSMILPACGIMVFFFIFRKKRTGRSTKSKQK
jgi:uncharacterized repeat protein (TIGR01451 family)